MSIYESARFLTSSSSISGLPAASLPEIAFAGRSNAGKSTTINVLTRQGKLAYASKTPGRTQLINFFELARKDPASHERIPLGYLVDLPGYGFAKATEQVRSSWSDLVGGYIDSRSSLIGVVLVMDARRPFMPSDEWVISFLAKRPTMRMAWLLNKADQLRTVSERCALIRRVRERAAEFANPVSVQLFSGLKKTGAEELRSTLDSWLGIG
ncbi:ribosome biogenesis GTP-binding protein YihA/YsxC [Mesosutterella sp. AGMB02718]|uniref:Probable GTP-binding protein EngB n=1 Tax=Mesosutterella faecium TaxID=2925194 RepID=A0ABT7IK42_9BURK|nr:ribosome biogenesis GTP-binding protein YihA/YsxC [Mesosutterella sp. AGMB02718]MDL2058730.1 ribosome biogenesis GTP-binding protein YihA/YsxC [Mesosutterella sp. AGMB02718]